MIQFPIESTLVTDGGEEDDDTYGIAEIVELEETAPPTLDYQPQDPNDYRPGIALIGTGGIAEQHLTAYRNAGYNVVALCNRTPEKAESYRDRYYPDAAVYTDYEEVLVQSEIEVVDILTHPVQRESIIEDAIQAGKHVLSQKPFVVDLDVGERLVDLAEAKQVRLAVNQNGRWAPHWSYLRQAIAYGYLGKPHGIHFTVDWNHNWIGETEVNEVEHAILYDFGIHWFDILHCFMGDNDPKRVYAAVCPTPSQSADPPMLAQAIVEYDDAQANIAFNADTKLGPQDRTYVAGTKGTAVSQGPDLEDQSVTIFWKDGYASPSIEGTWFPDGFHGAMAELLSAIEADRSPSHSARDNLRSLELCYAAVASAEDHEPKRPGEVRRMRGITN